MARIHQFQVKTIDGKEEDLSKYFGQVLLIVNVASGCVFTAQYESLEALYQKYHSKGLSVLGFPCNQFRNQEPDDESKIKSFCQTRFGVTFPLFSKIDVNGKNTHPLFDYLKKEKSGFLGTKQIKWNFTKFLVDRKGNVVRRAGPSVEPDSLESEIQELIAQS